MNRKIKQYLLFTFVLSWSSWGLLILASVLNLNYLTYGNPTGMVLFILGGCSPAICGIIIHKRNSEKEEFHLFMKSITGVRHSLWSYLYAIGGALLILFVPVLFGYGSMKKPIYLGFVMILPMIIGGGLEEIGWRGLLLPELEKKLSHSLSTLLVSIVWACWHVPLWFIEGSNQQSMNYGWFCIYAIALSFFIGSVRYVSQSIFMAILAHGAINGFWEVIEPSKDYAVSIVLIIIVGVLTLAIDNRGKKAVRRP